MSYPVVQTADTAIDFGTSGNPTTHTYPLNLQAGDLILLLMAIDSLRLWTPPSSPWVGTYRKFDDLGAGSGGCTAAWAKKVSDGTESGGTFTSAISSNVSWQSRTFRITGWGGTLGSNFLNDASSGDVVCGFEDTTSTSADPPAIDPATWDIADALVFAWYSRDTADPTVDYPAGYTDIQTTDIANTCSLGICADFDIAPASSYDPGPFTIANENWIALTTVIKGQDNPVIGTFFAPVIYGHGAA